MRSLLDAATMQPQAAVPSHIARESNGVLVHAPARPGLRNAARFRNIDVGEDRVFRCRLTNAKAQIQHLRVHDHRWVTLEQMSQYQFPDADAKTLAKLLDLEA